MNFKRITLTIGMTMLAALLTACGGAPEEVKAPADENELPAVTDEDEFVVSLVKIPHLDAVVNYVN